MDRTKNEPTRKTYCSVPPVLGLNTPTMARHGAGGSARQNNAGAAPCPAQSGKNHPNAQRHNTTNRALCLNRVAGLPRPAPAPTGSRQAEKDEHTLNLGQKRKQYQKQLKEKKPSPQNPTKTENYRAQRRWENPLYKSAPRDSSKLRCTLRENALVKFTCRYQEPPTAPVEVV